VNNEEYFPGLVSIGAPLMNYRIGRVLGAISFDFASAEAPMNLIERKYSGVLIKLAKDISEIITITEN
jgi:DNA-binding IclR family transcriptional regulator